MPAYTIAILYLILPNLPQLLANRWIETMPHGYINLEFLLIGAVGVFLPRVAVFLLLLLDSLMGFTYSICYTYQFSLDSLRPSMRYILLLPKVRLFDGLAGLTVITLTSAALALVRPHPHQRLLTMGALLVLVALLVPIDILDGQNPFFHKDMTLVPFRVTSSPTFTLGVRGAFDHWISSKSESAHNTQMSSASSQVVSFLESAGNRGESPDVVLILVESWGLALDPRLAQALTAPYEDPRIARKYRISYGAAPFFGLTVPGEARELCHSTLAFGILHASSEEANQCLPAWFHARGYENFAIHGYLGQMFGRNLWYPKLGFDQTWFGPALQKQGLPNCIGAFPGVCDANIARWMGGSLLSVGQGKPRFIYWVTLNSHLPVPKNRSVLDNEFCKTQPELRGSDVLCSWFRLVRTVHESVQQVALGPTARPTIFVLVGDHAPPFSNPQLAQEFSSSQVPYVILTPHALSPAN